MIKKVKILQEFSLSDGNYGLTSNVGIKDSCHPDTEFFVVKYEEEALWITNMSHKEDSVFVYFPSCDFGTYIWEGHVEEIGDV